MTLPSDLLAQIQAHVVGLLGEEDPEFVDDLVETFTETARGALADARSASHAADAPRLAAAAHTLKGSASNVGLAGIADAWDDVETAARQGSDAGAATDRALAATASAVATLADARAA